MLNLLHLARCILISATVCLSLLSTARAETYYVDASNNQTGSDGLSWKNAFKTLQEALTVYDRGDTILMAKGVYHPGTTSADTYLFRGAVTIQGGFPSGGGVSADPLTHKTVLSGDYTESLPDTNGDGVPDGGPAVNSSHHIMTLHEPAGPTVLDGLWFVSGHSQSGGFLEPGGSAILAVDGGVLTLNRCYFYFNDTDADLGTAVCYINDPEASPQALEVSQCVFQQNGNNSTPYAYGALYVENHSLQLTDTLFVENYSQYGGGLYFEGLDGPGFEPHSHIARCQFKGNYAHRFGGAVYTFTKINLEVVNTLFSGNHAGHYGFSNTGGGGVYIRHNGEAVFTNNTFAYNTCGGSIDKYPAYGGAVLFAGNGFSGTTTFSNNIFHQNWGAGGFSPLQMSVHVDGQTARTPAFYSNYSDSEDLPNADPAEPNFTPFQADAPPTLTFQSPINLTVSTVGDHTRFLKSSAGYLHLPPDSGLIDLTRKKYLVHPWDDEDADGKLRSLGYAPDPGAFEARPAPGTKKIIDIEYTGSQIRLYFLTDAPVDIHRSDDLQDWSSYNVIQNQSRSPIVFGISSSVPMQYYRLSHTAQE
ncbi:right-handed parallel beta-helix repeat-containing protein [Oceaniferula spumae]